jgi:hypothetical protein
MLSLYRTFLLRWTARIGTLICLAVLTLLYVDEGIDPVRVAGREWLGLAFFPGGLALGLILAWRWEGTGSLIALGSLAAFYVIYGWWLSGNLWQGAASIVFAAPAVLYLADWLLSIQPAVKQDRLTKPQ